MRCATALSLSLPFTLALAIAAAPSPAGAEPAWDDSHMRSNFARQRGPAPPRPAVQGADRYHRAIEDPAPTPPTSVAETTLRISPHAWTPGGPSASTGSSPPPWASPSTGFASSGARPTTSSGVRSSSSRGAGTGLGSTSLGSQRYHR